MLNIKPMEDNLNHLNLSKDNIEKYLNCESIMEDHNMIVFKKDKWGIILSKRDGIREVTVYNPMFRVTKTSRNLHELSKFMFYVDESEQTIPFTDEYTQILLVNAIIKKNMILLNNMKENGALWEEENWSDEKMRTHEELVRTLASVLGDLNRALGNI